MRTLLHTGLLVLMALAGPAWAQIDCPSLPAPTGAIITVGPDQASQLRQILLNAATGTTILLRDGLYDMSAGDTASRLSFYTPGITLRSASGNPDGVVLDGGYSTHELVSINASDVVIANLTLQRAYDHPVHISGLPGQPIRDVVIHGVTILDPGQQAIKVNADQDGYADYGIIECSRIELTHEGRSHIRNGCYTGGIDMHKARGWIVRRNHISGFWCESGLSEHGIHFWSASRDTLIEGNVIVDCARGIGLGLGQSGADRPYADHPYPASGYLGHIDGLIRNNFVAASDTALLASQFGFDVGIALEQVRGAQILHNTVASTVAPYSSIEWRFSNTAVELANNLVTHNLRARDGGQSTSTANLENANSNWFVDIGTGDLHLTSQALLPLDAGASLAPTAAPFDFDAQLRDSRPDIGADERDPAVLFGDGFESGGLARWITPP